MRAEPTTDVQTLVVDISSSIWITANHRNHWSRTAEAVKSLRLIGRSQARAQGLRPTVGRVVVDAVIHGRTNRRWDPNNANPTTKALIDGMTDAGVFPDDDWKHVDGPHHHHGEAIRDLPKGVHRVVFTLSPAPAGEQQ